ncbi:MAG: sulfotransferase [Bacteroidota bacterium]|nr:sulfotransferase [Bacteroidota bacterium]
MTKADQSIEKIPFFFIIGRPRSGTTLVQSILDAHPNVMIPAESPLILRLYMKYNKLQELNDNSIDELIGFIKQQPKIEIWPLNFDQLRKDLQANKGTFNFRNFIKIVYKNFQSAFPKKEILVFGDKNPRYSKYPKILLEIFPDAKFLHIKRDYRDHYLSVKKTGLLFSMVTLTIFLWKRSIIWLDRFSKKHPNQFYTFRYEDFVGKPEFHLNEICKFLNIPYLDELMNFHKAKDKTLNHYKEKTDSLFHEKVYTPIDARNTEKWKKALSEREVMIADYIAGKTAENSGYKRKYTNIPFKLKVLLLTRVTVIKMFLYFRFMLKILPFGLREKVNPHIPNLDSFYNRIFKS